MTDSFDDLIPGSVAFLRKLRTNNNREWFQANRADYDAAIKAPATAFGAIIASALEELTGAVHTPKLFRANRDVRFSKDKTPYNTHMHMLWSAAGGPGWFFGVSPDYVTAGCGMMSFDKTRLAAYRALVDKEGDRIATVLAPLIAGGFRMDEPDLKRVPPPFDKDHAHGDLLRRKAFAIWRDDLCARKPADKLMQIFARLKPVHDVLLKL